MEEPGVKPLKREETLEQVAWSGARPATNDPGVVTVDQGFEDGLTLFLTFIHGEVTSKANSEIAIY
jgi:hypothetical protein